MELLQRGIVVVEKFLDVNEENCVKVGRWFIVLYSVLFYMHMYYMCC